jgi:hypothetical protein
MTKEEIMSFSERMKDILDQGWIVSKEFAAKAGAKAQDLGERGVLMVEIKQLESQAQKLFSRMGNEAYIAFVEHDQSGIDRDAPEFRVLLEEIRLVKEAIERKETELKLRKTT